MRAGEGPMMAGKRGTIAGAEWTVVGAEPLMMHARCPATRATGPRISCEERRSFLAEGQKSTADSEPQRWTLSTLSGRQLLPAGALTMGGRWPTTWRRGRWWEAAQRADPPSRGS